MLARRLSLLIFFIPVISICCANSLQANTVSIKNVSTTKNATMIQLFTTLTLEGKTVTGTVDTIAYEVSSAEQLPSPSPTAEEDVLKMRFPKLELSTSLPVQANEENAATYYIKAIEYFEQDKEVEKLKDNFPVLAKRPFIKKAMAEIFNGAHKRRCDFTIKYPPQGDLISGMAPNYWALGACAKTMAFSANEYSTKGGHNTASEIAKSIIALGNHLRQSAYFSFQEFYGMRIEKIGAEQLLKTYQLSQNYEGQKSSSVLLNNLEETIIVYKAKLKQIRKDAPFWQIVPPLPTSASELLSALEEAEPIFRIDGLQIIGTLYTKKYDNDPRLSISRDANFPAFQKSRQKDIQIVKSRVADLAEKDPDPRVRQVAKLVLSIIEQFK